MATGRMDPTTRFVRSLPGKYFMVREAAAQLEVSDRTLRRLYTADRGLGPQKMVYFGKVLVYLYSREDIERIRAYFGESKQILQVTGQPKTNGRPPKWTASQRKLRQKYYSRANYHKNRIKELEKQGKSTTKSEAVLDEIATQLAKMEHHA